MPYAGGARTLYRRALDSATRSAWTQGSAGREIYNMQL